ncbi:MAG: hypothetical protein GXX85_07280 [Ignavibacteria bacterium]|nr:hypothetical protein [Ignavibacteria bacterium]
MVELNKLKTKCKTTEADTVSGRIISEYQNSGLSSDTYLSSVFDSLKIGSAELTKAVNRIKSESDLEEKDILRDSKVRAVNYLVLGFKHHPDEIISAAAEKVGKVFEHYGLEIIKESYAVESSLIESLLEDFNKPETKTAIEALPGLSRVLEDLNAAQVKFEEANLAFEKEKSIEGNLDNATTIKQEVVSIINNNLVVYLRAMCLSDEAKYGNFSRAVAQIIDDSNTTVKRRTGKQEPAANNVKQ